MAKKSENGSFSVVTDLDVATGAALFASMREYRDKEPHVSATAWLDKDLPPQLRIVELGPGTGEDADRLVREGHTVTGVDVRIDLCVPHGWELRQGNALHLPVADESVDMVRANRVIHHVEPHLGFLKEAYRVLIPGGIVRMSFPERTMMTVSDKEVESILRTVMTMTNVDTYNPVVLPLLVQDVHAAGFSDLQVASFEGTFHGEDVFIYGFPEPAKHAAAARQLLGDVAGDKLEWFAQECEAGQGWITVVMVCVEAKKL